MPLGVTPDLSVIVVSFETRALTSACVASVLSNAGKLKVEVIVVDNASRDGTAEHLRQTFPCVEVIASPVNGGFAAGNLLGLRAARAPRLLLLNPDAEIEVDTLANAMAALDADPGLGVVGARVHMPDGSNQSSMIRAPSLGALALNILFPNNVLRNSRWIGDVRYASRDPDRPQDVDAVAGGFMAFRREVLDTAGALDPRFFIYGEEVEWCHRIRKAGWRIEYRPEVRMLHHGGASTSHRTVWKAREMMRGQLLCLALIRGRWAARLAALLMVMRDCLRLPFAFLRGKSGFQALLARLKLGLASLVLPPAGQKLPDDFLKSWDVRI